MAVQSHWFRVGPLCAWARAGVGAVATQSVVEPAYGPNALDRLAEGVGAPAGARRAARRRPARRRPPGRGDRRRAASSPTHTGKDCIAHAGHVTGEHHSCQANMMARDTVPQAMSDAFVAATGRAAGPPARRARRGGGRRRRRPRPPVGGDGRRARPTASPGGGRVDLRVEDHGAPLDELRRLLTLQRAYDLAGAGDELLAAGRTDEAGALYQRAAELAPDSDELLFWSGLALAQAGDLEGGVAAVRRAAEENPNWLVLLDRLSPEFAPAGEARASADHLKVERGRRRRRVSTFTAVGVFGVAGDARGACGGRADRRGRERALADVLVEVDRVDVAGRRRRSAPRPATAQRAVAGAAVAVTLAAKGSRRRAR